jgi:hypothetical protein
LIGGFFFVLSELTLHHIIVEPISSLGLSRYKGQVLVSFGDRNEKSSEYFKFKHHNPTALILVSLVPSHPFDSCLGGGARQPELAAEEPSRGIVCDASRGRNR